MESSRDLFKLCVEKIAARTIFFEAAVSGNRVEREEISRAFEAR